MIFTFLLGWVGLSLSFLLLNFLLSSCLNQLKENFLRKLHNADCSLISPSWKTLTQRICDSVILLRLIWCLGMITYFYQRRGLLFQCSYYFALYKVVKYELVWEMWYIYDFLLESPISSIMEVSLFGFFSVVHENVIHASEGKQQEIENRSLQHAQLHGWTVFLSGGTGWFRLVKKWTKISNTMSLQVKEGTQLPFLIQAFILKRKDCVYRWGKPFVWL